MLRASIFARQSLLLRRYTSLGSTEISAGNEINQVKTASSTSPSVDVSTATPNEKSERSQTSQTPDNSASLAAQRFLSGLSRGTPELKDIEKAFEANQEQLKKGVVLPHASARLSLLFINAGMPEKAIEPWVQMLETIGTKTTRLEKVVSKDQFQAPALAALAAYILASGSAENFDPDTASKLVMRKDVPVSIAHILSPYGKIKSGKDLGLIESAMAKLRKHASANYTSQEFIDQIGQCSFKDIGHLWKEVEKVENLPENVYAAFIRRFAETRQIDRSFSIWNILVGKFGDSVSVTSWAALLRAASLAPTNSHDIMNGVWDRMIKAGITPDSKCYEVKIQNLTRNRKFSEALQLYQELSKSQPDKIDMYIINNSLVAAANGFRDFDLVDRILEDVSRFKLTPTSHTFNIVLKAAQAAKRADLSEKYLSKMMESGLAPDVVTYTHVISRLLERGMPIDSVLEEMKQHGIKPNEYLYTTLAHGLGRLQKNVEYGRYIFKVMQKTPGLKLGIETFGALIDLELRLGGTAGLENAVRYLRFMPTQGLPPNVPTYNQVIRGAMQKHRYDIAKELFEEMCSGRQVRLAPNTHTFMFLFGDDFDYTTEMKSEFRQLVSNGFQVLASRPSSLLDYPLAKKIDHISSLVPGLVPAELESKIRDVLVLGFDPKKRHR